MSDDVTMVAQMLDRVAASPEEAAAARRVLGVDEAARRASLAMAPELPPPPELRPDIDHVAHARGTVARYQTWTDSYPDDDPTPLRERARAVRLAVMDLQRLEGGI